MYVCMITVQGEIKNENNENNTASYKHTSIKILHTIFFKHMQAYVVNEIVIHKK